MAHIYGISRNGRLREYETLELAIAAKEFIVIEGIHTGNSSRFQIWSDESWDSFFLHNNWKLKFTGTGARDTLYYDVVDYGGVVKHFRTGEGYLSGLSEMVCQFSSHVNYADYNEYEMAQFEEVKKHEHKTLQSQFNELKEELSVLKVKVEELEAMTSKI